MSTKNDIEHSFDLIKSKAHKIFKKYQKFKTPIIKEIKSIIKPYLKESKYIDSFYVYSIDI